MKKNKFVLLILIAVAAAAFISLWSARRPADRTRELMTALAPAFSKYGLTDANLVRVTVQDAREGLQKYLSEYREYDLPASLSLKKFESALRERLGKTRFRVAKSDSVFAKGSESGIFTIRFGRYDILSLLVK